MNDSYSNGHLRGECKQIFRIMLNSKNLKHLLYSVGYGKNKKIGTATTPLAVLQLIS